jgi:hypothetical protein
VAAGNREAASKVAAGNREAASKVAAGSRAAAGPVAGRASKAPVDPAELGKTNRSTGQFGLAGTTLIAGNAVRAAGVARTPLRDNDRSIVFTLLFMFLADRLVAGWDDFIDEQRDHGGHLASYAATRDLASKPRLKRQAMLQIFRSLRSQRE